MLAAGGDEIAVTVSVGCAASAVESADGLVKRADVALYEAKEGGRNRVAVARPPATEKAPDLTAEHRFRVAAGGAA